MAPAAAPQVRTAPPPLAVPTGMGLRQVRGAPKAPAAPAGTPWEQMVLGQQTLATL